MIISPISYPGNKAKVLNQLVPELCTNVEKIVDVFCGSGIVAINTNYKELYCNDKSKQAIDLLKYFYYNESEKVVKDIEKIIKKYNLTYSRIKPKTYYKIYKHEGLSRYNKEGFEQLKNDYNISPTSDKLFALLIYGFNHYIRFNRKGFFNVPVGKVDFSQSIYEKTIKFVNGIKKHKIFFSNKDFRDNTLYDVENAIFYFDPPYLITQAPYNMHWDEKDEEELLNLLDQLNQKNKKFVLSNVLKSNGKENKRLIKWSKKYNLILVKRQYKNANYRRKNLSDTVEVIVKNF